MRKALLNQSKIQPKDAENSGAVVRVSNNFLESIIRKSVIPLFIGLLTTLFMMSACSSSNEPNGNDNKPELSVPNTSISFANTEINKTTTEEIDVKNTGNADLNVTASSDDSVVFAIDWSSATIKPNETQKLKVIFKPTEAKSYDGSITITGTNADGKKVSVSVSGKGEHEGGLGGEQYTDLTYDYVDSLFTATVIEDKNKYKDYQHVVVPSTVKNDYRFYNVSTIGEAAFMDCISLASISAPNVSTIGGWAFSDCRSLVSISLPSATTIGGSAFAGCIGLVSISLPDTYTIGEEAFINCSSLASVNLPNAYIIGEGVFAYCISLSSISLPNATTIGESAFEHCPILSSISLPNASTIGEYAFNHCDKLTILKLGYNSAININFDEVIGTDFDQINLYLGTFEYGQADKINNIWKGLTWKSINPY